MGSEVCIRDRLSTKFVFNNLLDNDQIEIFKYAGLKNSKILLIINIKDFVLGIFIIFFFYNLSSNVKSLYLQLKTNYTQDDKYLAVITNNGLWIKDVINSKTLMINAAKIDKNFLVDIYISEFDQNFLLLEEELSTSFIRCATVFTHRHFRDRAEGIKTFERILLSWAKTKPVIYAANSNDEMIVGNQAYAASMLMGDFASFTLFIMMILISLKSSANL